MEQKVNWLITPQNIVVNYDGQTHSLLRTDAYASKLIDALKNKQWKKIPDLISQAKRIETFSKGAFQVQDGEILIKGVKAPAILGRKIQEFAREGLPYQPLVAFAEKLNQNPSHRAVTELYTFLEKNNHPITENGCFIAYKRVRPNFLDIHSGTMDNSVGNLMVVPRNQVDEDSSRTCSYGLHVANWDYAANHFGGSGDIMLEVEVNPADVVAIPADYNSSKMRVCQYRVLAVVDQENSTPLRVVSPTYDPHQDVDDDEDGEECEECGTVDDSVEYDSHHELTVCSDCSETLSDDEEEEEEEDDEDECDDCDCEDEEDEEDYDLNGL